MNKLVMMMALVLVSGSYGQEKTIVPSPWPVIPPPIFRPTEIREKESPVEIQLDRVIAEDNGLFRRVETTITFTNPNGRQFEGELEFPLPEGATVCGYELEVNGTMVPGVIVGKTEARVAFENEKRKRADPGLVENVKGNVWKTRIHPLQPKTPRKAKISYIVANDSPSQRVVVEQCGDEIFVGEYVGEQPIETKADRLRKAAKACLYWDASMSRQGKVAADRALLELLPEQGEFEVIVFRNIIEEPKKFATRAELLKYIDGLAYDGGTCLSKLPSDLCKQPASFIFSDEYCDPQARKIMVKKLGKGEQSPVEPKSGRLLAIAWAANRIADYTSQAESHKAEFLALGRKYGVASPVTSLMVLETLEQYLEYQIEPPSDLSFYGEWKRRRGAEDDPIALERRKSEHRSQLLRYWEERIRWWNDPIPVKSTPKSGVFGNLLRSAVGWASVETESAPVATREMSAEELVEDGDAANASAAMASTASTRGVRYLAVKAAAAESSAAGSTAAIRIAAWDPKMPYLEAISQAPSAYQEYLKQRELFGSSPAFYLDCAGWFFKAKDFKLGARIISNLSELQLEEVGLWRTMGWRLREAGLYEEAIEAFRHVLELRPEEPQSKRDLALVLTEYGKSAWKQNPEQLNYLVEAAKLLKSVAFEPSARRSGRADNDLQTSVIALEELNGLRMWWTAKKIGEPFPINLDAAFCRDMPCRLRIMLSWDTDETDVDLHVLEPDGEEAFYGHRRTSTGGFVSEDVTTGYGPEEYLRKDSGNGIYRIAANYFASHRQALTGAATITATVYTDWGTDREKREIMSLRLDQPKAKHPIGEVEIR